VYLTEYVEPDGAYLYTLESAYTNDESDGKHARRTKFNLTNNYDCCFETVAYFRKSKIFVYLTEYVDPDEYRHKLLYQIPTTHVRTKTRTTVMTGRRFLLH
jgi:hypothetical protein